MNLEQWQEYSKEEIERYRIKHINTKAAVKTIEGKIEKLSWWMWIARGCLNRELEKAKSEEGHASRHYDDKQFNVSEMYNEFCASNYGQVYLEQQRMRKSKNKILNI